MIRRLFGRRVTLQVTVAGLVGQHMVHWNGAVHLRGRPDVRAALRAAGREAGVDLLGVLAEGGEPVVLLDGLRIDLPADLVRPVADGVRLSWLQPMVGG